MGTNYECCMCGDYGLANELFRCKVCQFRSQHRYCSNLYPKAETYRVCNWCLIEASDAQTKASNSSNSSSSPAGGEDDPRHPTHGKSRKKSSGCSNNSQHYDSGATIKKQKSPEGSPSGASLGRRTTVSVAGKGGNGAKEEDRDSKSDEMANGSVTNGVMRQVFRGKVRRYKLLDEVSS
ncbi:hypothetical protein Droror1_Dr00011287 [Drosera rotundifolia]